MIEIEIFFKSSSKCINVHKCKKILIVSFLENMNHMKVPVLSFKNLLKIDIFLTF